MFGSIILLMGTNVALKSTSQPQLKFCEFGSKSLLGSICLPYIRIMWFHAPPGTVTSLSRFIWIDSLALKPGTTKTIISQASREPCRVTSLEVHFAGIRMLCDKKKIPIVTSILTLVSYFSIRFLYEATNGNCLRWQKK